MPGYQSIPDHVVEAIPLQKFWSKVFKQPSGCWEWQGSIDTWGYGQFWILNRHRLAHRISFTLVKGAIPRGLLVLHTCDNRVCVNPAHLFLGTDMDNTRDMISKGRNNPPTGERAHKAKLTWKIAREIREIWATGKHSLSGLARIYGVYPQAIRYVVTNKTWKE